MKLNIMIAIIIWLFAPVAHAETVILEGQCRKTSDSGCTANNTGTYQAPAGKYIEPDSVTAGSVVSFNGKEPRCMDPVLDGRFSYTIPNTTATATFFTAFKAHVQVQSGSGLNNMQQVFKIKCEYKFRLGNLPR